jgi:hypothetical protein
VISYFAEGSSDHSSRDGQFDNAEEEVLSCEAVPDHSFQKRDSSYEATPDHTENTTEATSDPSSSSAGPAKVENADTVTFRKDLKPKKLVHRNRNALLNSLANYSKGLGTESDSRKEIKTNSPVQNNNSSCASALTPTGTAPNHFKYRSKFPLAAQGAGISVHDISSRIRESKGGFKFRDEDFPPL